MDIGAFHPILVHFPVVFFTLAVALDLWQYLTQDRTPSYYSHWLYLLGALSLIPTIFTGIDESSNKAETIYLHLHQSLAYFLAILVFTQTAIRLFYLKGLYFISNQYIVFLSVVIFLVVSLTGDVGGILSRGSTPFSSENLLMHNYDYNSADPREVRKYTPKELSEYLVKKIDVLDVIPIFQRHRCASCHSDRFEGELPSRFTVKTAEEDPWLERDEKNQLIDWEKSSFYKTTILFNRMPIDEDKNSTGISWSDRLILIHWLENNAPTEIPKAPD